MPAERPSWAPQHIDLEKPNAARVYDYLLGGGCNFEQDRTFAKQFLQIVPNVDRSFRANRAFLRRAVRFCVDAGIRQFLDIGSGIPTVGNVHEIAQGMAPECKVVYVDNEPVAVAHSEAILEDNDRATVLLADLSDPDTILNAAPVRELLDLDQDAILEASRRAVQYAENHGVLNVAAAGNENYNLASKTTDATSPDDSTPVRRTVGNTCLSVPGELPGVVSVSAITSGNAKSSYSNFGTNKVHLTAPGNSVFSTLPGGGYGTMSGTSMAAPHVAGVAALLASVDPAATPATLRTRLAAQADNLRCPTGDSRCTGTTAEIGRASCRERV